MSLDLLERHLLPSALTPIIGVDIWEHAFYLQYKNVKPDYLAAYWNVNNWAEAQKRFEVSSGASSPTKEPPVKVS